MPVGRVILLLIGKGWDRKDCYKLITNFRIKKVYINRLIVCEIGFQKAGFSCAPGTKHKKTMRFRDVKRSMNHDPNIASLFGSLSRSI